MKTLIPFLIILLIALCCPVSNGQEYNTLSDQNLNAMSIPSSPAFGLLGVNPEIVTRPSDVKEFKVDWRVKNYKIAPDLALEAQPLWWLHYRKKSPEAFKSISNFERILSTASVSLATAKIDNVNHMAYATKFNVYKEYDPFRDTSLIAKNEMELKKEIEPIVQQIEKLEIERKKTVHQDSIAALIEEIELLRLQREAIYKSKMEQFVAECNLAIQEYWNMDMVDVACGRVYKYDNASLDSLNFKKAGYGIWINAAKGIGRNSLLTGILKMNKIGENRNFMLGLAYRYGSHKYNFFAEVVRTKMNNVPDNGFSEEEIFANLRSDDIGSAWYQYADGEESYTNWTLAYGGDFKLSRNILLNFALRTELTKGFKFTRFLPVANIVCLMN